MAHLADELGHLEAGQLAALAGLGTLRDLDLDLAAMVEVFGGDAETARRHLFDRRVGVVAIGARHITCGVLAAFTRDGACAHPVHGDVQRFVRFGRQSSQRHGLRQEALADVRDAFDLVKLDGLEAVLEVEQVAQGQVRLFGDSCGILFVAPVVATVHRILQQVDGLGVMAVGLAARTDAEEAAHGRGRGLFRREGRLMALQGRALQTGQTDARNARRGIGEELCRQGARQAQNLELATAAIGGHDRDTLAGQHFQQTCLDALLIVQAGVLQRQVAIEAALQTLLKQFLGQPRINGGRAHPDQHGKGVRVERFGRTHDDGAIGA